MEPIDSQALENVRGGFGAILGALLQAAPGIINSVSGLVSASKGGGGGGQTAVAQTQPTAAAPMSTPPSMPAAPTQMASAPSGGSCACSCSSMLPTAPSVQNSVRIG